MGSDDVKAGVVLDDRYELLEQIGEGGHGQVFKAKQRNTGQDVAAKILSAVDDAELLGRFEREMKLLAKLSHPHLVNLIDSGVWKGRNFIILEYVDGETLADRMSREPIAPATARRIMLQVLEAAQVAHQQGIIHRDLKPENIMLTGSVERPIAKVLDFGIAKATRTFEENWDSLTRTDIGPGTPSYIAPELVVTEEGEDEAGPSPPTDLYSAGLILLEMLTGDRAVTGKTPAEILIKHVKQPVQIPQAIRKSPFGPVIERAIAYERSDRYADAGAMLDDLEDISAGEMERDFHAEGEETTIIPLTPDPRGKGTDLLEEPEATTLGSSPGAPDDSLPASAHRRKTASPDQSGEGAYPELRALRESMEENTDAAETEGLDPDDLLGVAIDDQYRIEECIGSDELTVVYRARQEARDRHVAIRVLPEQLVDTEGAVARFEGETRAVSRLEHPNIVSTYDFGQETGVPYICMEYIEGVTLAEQMAQGPLSLREFCTTAVQILQGLGEAHAMDVVHRDLKPANIMLCDPQEFDRDVKVLDFGLAKLLQGTDEVTKGQKLVGSVSFLSPEQALGKSVDERADVYSLGVLFYNMLSGEKPFTAEEDIRVLSKHVDDSPLELYDRVPEPAELPEPLVDLIHRCLSKKPENRPEDANALLEEFTSAVPRDSIHLPSSTGEPHATAGSGADPDSPRDSLPPSAETGPLRPGPSPERDSPGVDRQVGSNAAAPGEGAPPAEYSWASSNVLPIVAGLVLVGGLGLLTVSMVGGSDGTSADQRPPDQQKTSVALQQETETSEGDRRGESAPSDAEKPSLRIESDPGGTVTIDGRPIGSSPAQTTLEPGQHDLEVSSDDHETWSKTITLEPGDEPTYRVSLTPEKHEQTEESQPSKRSGGAGARRGTRSGATPDGSRTRRGSTGSAAQESGSGRRPTDEPDETANAQSSKSPEGSESPKETEETASATDRGDEESTTPDISAGAESAKTGSTDSESEGSNEPDNSESGVGVLPADSSDSSDDTNDGNGEGGGLLPVEE